MTKKLDTSLVLAVGLASAILITFGFVFWVRTSSFLPYVIMLAGILGFALSLIALFYYVFSWLRNEKEN